MSFWFRNWARYDYIKVKLMKDPLTQRGFAAWCILTFVVVTSVAPARRISYEVFVISHLITFAGFMAAVWLHAPDEVKIWVWLPIAFFAVERLLKAKRLLFLNLTLFQFKKRRASGLWANSASFRPLPGGVTKITVETPAFTWSPGQHVLLSCHSILPLQSHPFTIASLPSDGRLEFFVKAHRGGTKSFLNHASTNATLPISTPNNRSITRKVAIEGPFGRMRSLEQFDSIIFFAGSTGATFILPHMRHIVALWRYWESRRVDSLLWKPKEALTRRIRFVWVVKSRDHIEWFKTQLQQVIDDTTVHRAIDKRLDRKVDISTYITCDEELVAEKNDPGNCCQQSSHGEAQQTDITSSERPTLAKKDMGDTEVTSVGSSQQTAREDRGCAPDGSCCCKATVEDESNAPTCTCSRPVKSADVDVSPIKPESKMEIYPAITQNPPMKVLSGRPQPRSIIRKVLEEAEGESAVVVCGPPELRDSVRASVVALSDERAVHKGTGAQGIYLHIEGFDY